MTDCQHCILKRSDFKKPLEISEKHFHTAAYERSTWACSEEVATTSNLTALKAIKKAKRAQGPKQHKLGQKKQEKSVQVEMELEHTK